ncbi:efflux RND transporter periplasmic adaptor subunit [candidate division KSB1 bacterium]|nr:efflux RND transporter periplasmic adaptor subunit [candidate division KSB1 bacterium]
MIQKRWLHMILITIIAVVAFSGCNKSTNDNNETKVPVDIEVAALGQITQSIFYTGDINAEYDVKVFSKIPDRIEAYYVDEGDAVKAGDPIVKIVATTIEQAVHQAEAGLAAATAQKMNIESEYARAKRLFGENAMSKQQYDAVETQYESVNAQVKQATAALATAKSQYRDATVSAPISGIIGKRYFEVGDMAAPSVPVVSVVQMENVKILVDVTEQDMGRLKVGQKANITVRSYPDEIFSGKVVKISPILDPITRMGSVEILLANPEHRLKPGMYAEIEIIVGTIDNKIVIPRFAVTENTSLKSNNGKDQVIKNYYVYVVDDSLHAEQRLLDVYYVNHKSLAVNSGIKIGEKYVVAGQNNLRDGLSVLVAEQEEGNE